MEHGDANVQRPYARETRRNNIENTKEPESIQDPRSSHRRNRDRNIRKSTNKETLTTPQKIVVAEKP